VSPAGQGAPGQGAPAAGQERSQGKGAGTDAGKGAGADNGKGRDEQQTVGQPGGGAGEAGDGGRAGGDGTKRPEGTRLQDGPPPAQETEWGEQDLAHARNAADLAVSHLRREVEAGESDVLDRLGWTRDEARAFLDRWEKMRKLAASADPVERGDFERAMRSLGLRPEGVSSSHDVPTDVRGGQAEGRRSRPPSDYMEQFKAYTQGTAGE